MSFHFSSERVPPLPWVSFYPGSLSLCRITLFFPTEARQGSPFGDRYHSLATTLGKAPTLVLGGPHMKVSRIWKRGTLLYCWWNCKFVKSPLKSIWQFLRKLEIVLPEEQAPGNIPKRCSTISQGHVHSSFIHK